MRKQRSAAEAIMPAGRVSLPPLNWQFQRRREVASDDVFSVPQGYKLHPEAIYIVESVGQGGMQTLKINICNL